MSNKPVYNQSTDQNVINLFGRKICHTSEEFTNISKKYQLCDYETHKQDNIVLVTYCVKNNIIVDSSDNNNIYVTYKNKKIAVSKQILKNITEIPTVQKKSRFNGTTFIYGCFG